MADAIEEFLEHADFELEFEYEGVNTTLDVIQNRILSLQDVILYGPPGTGKSFLIDNVLNAIKDRVGLTEKIQFHSEYTYDDFVEGLRPVEGQGAGFEYEEGVFFSFCEKVKKQDSKGEKIHPFFIDEINRANITSVFGEVLYLMEKKGTRILPTAKKKRDFLIPKNVVIVGTMNTADKSLARLDFALRRRFRFLPVYPNQKLLQEIISLKGFSAELKGLLSEVDYIKGFEVLNAKITKHPLLGKDLTIGHVLWVPNIEDRNEITSEDLGEIFREIVIPQIESYCGSNKEALASIIGSELCECTVLGKRISNEMVLAFVVSLKNNKIK